MLSCFSAWAQEGHNVLPGGLLVETNLFQFNCHQHTFPDNPCVCSPNVNGSPGVPFKFHKIFICEKLSFDF